MKVFVQQLVADNSVRIIMECPEMWLKDNCERLPLEIAEMITAEQGIGIIQDAVIMAMGYKRNQSNAGKSDE